MGCICSRAVVHPEVATADTQQHLDKPWKKNQVLPVNEKAEQAEAAGFQQQVQEAKSLPAAFAGNGKDAEADGKAFRSVFTDLQDLCTDKVDGTRLTNLAERLHEILKRRLPSALKACTQPSDVAIFLGVAKRAVACCNSIIQPMLLHINRILSNQHASSSWSEGTSWEQVEFSDFLGMLEDASTATFDQGVMEVGRPVALLMELLHDLRQHCDAYKLSWEASTTQVPALDELIGMVGIIFFRKVVLETAETAQSKLEQYQQLQEQIGWTDAQLATCTCPEARAMLLYLHQVSSAGEKRTNVMVRRSSAFWDSFECARRDGLLPASHGPMCHKYFPLFVSEYAAGTAGSGRKRAVEAGEGHGPRKEFFMLAGQDMTGHAEQQQLQQAAGAAGGGASSPEAAAAVAAAASIFRESSGGASAASGGGADVGSSTSGGGATQASGSGNSHSRRPPLWLYNRTAGAYWYNTTLSETPELRGAYAFAGWLMGQCILNRAPLGLLLPPVLFRALIEGHSSAHGAQHGSEGGAGANGGGPGGGFQPTLDMLAEFDPDAAAAVRNVAALPADQLRGMLELEGLPGDWSAERYTQHAVSQVLRDGVAWQSKAVAAGLFAAVDRRLLRAWQLGPAALAALVAGGSGGGGGGAAGGEVPTDLSKLFRVALDEELSGSSAVLVEMLWEVLAGWPAERRRRFVEFVTGTARLPLPGSELLKIQAPFVAMGAAEHKATLGMLPQAHTCDNLLELPNYWESLLAVRGIRGGPAAVTRGSAQLTPEQLAELRAEARRILEERLELAVMNFQGYGLDERTGARGGGSSDGGGGGGGKDGDDGSQRNPRGDLAGPEPSVLPDLPLTPAALTADSLASLARLSASSSVLHASHPLAFSAAAAAAAAAAAGPGQTAGGQRGGGAGHAALASTAHLVAEASGGLAAESAGGGGRGGGLSGAPTPAPTNVLPGEGVSSVAVSAKAGGAGSGAHANQQQHRLESDAAAVMPGVTDAERQANILARFEVDLNDKKKGGGVSGNAYRQQHMQKRESSEESQDAFK
ncbi:hypothetical protein Agub_g9797 [Astrephomene gubernaculifera]|uniref:HECT-type E3 ubiquitin transferase n=1 Tax=Astrephomene gubernaculifera TaxID=47775 RepID=A0AAD3HP77_9CHLO|nr:hypothetical protein Agub_g9797 [Astrephomene gubernaculifera]